MEFKAFADCRSECGVYDLSGFALALPILLQQSLAADRFQPVLVGPPHHINHELESVADDLNIAG